MFKPNKDPFNSMALPPMTFGIKIEGEDGVHYYQDKLLAERDYFEYCHIFTNEVVNENSGIKKHAKVELGVYDNHFELVRTLLSTDINSASEIVANVPRDQLQFR